MKHTLKLFAFILLITLMAAPLQAQKKDEAEAAKETPREFEMKDGDTTYVMKQYILVLLRRGEKALEIPEEELQKIQQGHMENIGRLAELGKIQVAGPMGEDGDLRGIFVMDCATVEEAKELVATDPAIKAGRLRAEFYPWWCAKGTTLK